MHLAEFFQLPKNQKNGLCAFSSATVVSGPWPGQIKVSGGSVKICSRTFCFAKSHDWFPRLIDPAKIASPTMAACAFSSAVRSQPQDHPVPVHGQFPAEPLQNVQGDVPQQLLRRLQTSGYTPADRVIELFRQQIAYATLLVNALHQFRSGNRRLGGFDAKQFNRANAQNPAKLLHVNG